MHLRNPASLEALAGSQAIIRVPRSGPSIVRLNGAELPVDAEGVARTVLNQSGYLAIDAGAVHALLPLSVTPDRAPDVRITAPAKDMRVATTAVTIPIVAEAADDLALRSLELRYTIVSGTGEQFSFTEGTLPAALARGSDQVWRIATTLSPAGLKLEPGDALIYRAVAADRRPGDAGFASSDTFFVEIAGPGDVALAGVEMPPDKERYALSEAMIVLKIERLMAREKGMARPALEEAAGNIAAEQRAVRANFIFLLGGEIEDETVEAEIVGDCRGALRQQGAPGDRRRHGPDGAGGACAHGGVDEGGARVRARRRARVAARVRSQPVPASRAAGPRAHRPGAPAVG